MYNTHMYIHTYMYPYLSFSICMDMYVHMQTSRLPPCLYIYRYVFTKMNYISMYMHMNICIYIYIYTCIFAYT